MTEFDKIFVVWRKGKGDDRTAVGELTRTVEGKHFFKYLQEAVALKKDEGFVPYAEFQELDKIYNSNVAEIFAQRLTKSDRPDVKAFYDFWEVEPGKANDKFYLLGKTQGLLPTDNFEFLADYQYSPGLHFLTEVVGLSKTQVPGDYLKIGDVLNYKLDPQNLADKWAVKIFKGDTLIGHIKRYHSKVFHKAPANMLNVTVKALDKNGTVKRVFVKVTAKQESGIPVPVLFT